MKKTGVSIIVPVYNAEKYLGKCLASVLAQTYQDFELLLVDDGSTDTSGALCDACAAAHGNVRVFHQENRGQAAARNLGLQNAVGQYISYVDADDYLEPDFLQKLWDALHSGSGEAAQLAVCTHVDESPEGEDVTHRNPARSAVPRWMTAEEALSTMCYEILFGTAPWGKLIQTELARRFPFPSGNLYEDAATMYQIVGGANAVVYVGLPLYHYIISEGSVRRSSWKPQVIDVVNAGAALLAYIEERYPRLRPDGIYRYFFGANEYYIRAFGQPDYREIVEPVRRQLAAYWPELRRNEKASTPQKLRYWLMAHAPRLYRLVWQTVKGRK